VAEEPVAPRRLNHTLSPAIEGALLKALAKRPDARYRTCQEFTESLEKACAGADVLVMAAAVADYVPEQVAASKLRRTDRPMELRLRPNVDILKTLGARPGLYRVGFAAETEDLRAQAQQKLGAKQLDIEMQRDPAIRDYVARNGNPDFIYVPSATVVELIYFQSSKLILFYRDQSGAGSVTGELSPLPLEVTNVLPVDIRAGTPGPIARDTLTSCWTVSAATHRCHTCCEGPLFCSTSCEEEPSQSAGRALSTRARRPQ